MVEIYNITEWNNKYWVQTVGTRDKCYTENPIDEKLYFFKKSIEKYPSEFWSEIIASKIGKSLGFDLLDYNIGILDDTIGCICESMIDQKTEELEHGINLIKESNPDFKVTKRPIILFSDVERSFASQKHFIKKFIEVLIFDSIIGNQDRHSENWAIVRSLDVANLEYNKNRYLRWAYEQYKKSGLNLSNLPFKNFFIKTLNIAFLVNIKFSPIYDSGSSLGREIPEDKIPNYLNNDDEIKKYIRNGRSEVKWDGSKISHLDILKKIKPLYEEHLTKIVKNVLEKYNQTEIQGIVNNIDKELSQQYPKTELSLQRKELILKFIHFRIETLKELIN